MKRVVRASGLRNSTRAPGLKRRGTITGQTHGQPPGVARPRVAAFNATPQSRNAKKFHAKAPSAQSGTENSLQNARFLAIALQRKSPTIISAPQSRQGPPRIARQFNGGQHPAETLKPGGAKEGRSVVCRRAAVSNRRMRSSVTQARGLPAMSRGADPRRRATPPVRGAESVPRPRGGRRGSSYRPCLPPAQPPRTAVPRLPEAPIVEC